MLQKLNQQQLQNLSQEELKTYKFEGEKYKAELEALKSKGGKSWAPELQEELDELVLLLVDVDDAIVASADSQPEKNEEAKIESSYVVPAGTENMVHLLLIKGHRYSPTSGKEISEPFVQIFSYSEYKLFMNNGKSLGYEIKKVLHNPYENK